jgi:Rieske Fe-S protein
MEGAVLGGPAPRPLDRYQVKIEAGRIKIGSLEPHA